MVLNDLGELGPVADVVDPSGELGVPDESVASDGDVVLDGVVDEEVGGLPVVRVLRLVDLVPLHRVLGGELAKGGGDDGRVLGIAEEGLVGAGTEVELALLLHHPVDVGDGLAGLEVHEGHGGGGAGHEDAAELHGCVSFVCLHARVCVCVCRRVLDRGDGQAHKLGDQTRRGKALEEREGGGEGGEGVSEIFQLVA